MDRLNRYRNALKHTGAFPGADAVEDARSSTANFFEYNTPLVFGLDFAHIDMADVVTQEDARSRLKAAAVAEAAGDRTEAMAELAEAIAGLFRPYTSAPFGSYTFGQTVQPPRFPLGLESAMNTLSMHGRSQNSRDVTYIGRKVDQHIDQLTSAVASMQQAMRVVTLAVGIDYARYARFQRLTPRV